jgi:4-hydroxy-2-oxoglutarate aldolase
MLLEGLQLPLTTPFYADGRLNLHKLEHNVRRYSKTPVSGFVALSAIGEPNMLSDEETRQALRVVVEAAAAEKVLLAGVSRDSVAGTLELAEEAARLGYDALLVKQPTFFQNCTGKAGIKELVIYFQAVADRSPLPVVLYGDASDPSRRLLPADVVIELAAHPQVIGLVDVAGGRERIERFKAETLSVKRDVSVTSVFAAVTGRMRLATETSVGALISAGTLIDGGAAMAVAPAKPSVKTRTKVVGFQMLVADTGGMLEGLLAGATGAMPAFAAAAPQVCYEVLAAWKDGDRDLAQEKQVRLRPAVARVESTLRIAGIKYGCDLNGYFGGLARLPQLPLTGEERAEIELLMQGLRN